MGLLFGSKRRNIRAWEYALFEGKNDYLALPNIALYEKLTAAQIFFPHIRACQQYILEFQLIPRHLICCCGQMDVHGVILRIAIGEKVTSRTTALAKAAEFPCQRMRRYFHILAVYRHQHIHDGLAAHARDGGASDMPHVAFNVCPHQDLSDPFLHCLEPLYPLLLIGDNSDLVMKRTMRG